MGNNFCLFNGKDFYNNSLNCRESLSSKSLRVFTTVFEQGDMDILKPPRLRFP